MIFKKIHRGDTARGCFNTVKYILDDKGNNDRILLVESNCETPYLHGDCIKQFAKRFSREVADHHKKWDRLHRTRTNKLYEHYTISFPKEDNLTPVEVAKICREAMQSNIFFGLNRSYVLAIHGDQKNTIHGHLVADRRNSKGIAYNPKSDMKIWNRISSKIEEDRNLTKINRLNDGGVIRKEPPKPIPHAAVKKELKKLVSHALASKDLNSFIDFLCHSPSISQEL